MAEENTRDAHCPYIHLMFDDAMAGSRGEHKCLLASYPYGDLSHGGGSECLDYEPCNHPDHLSCPRYLENQRINKLL